MKDKLKEAILTFQNGKEIILESKKYNFDIGYFQIREEYNIFFRPLYKRMEIFNLKMKINKSIEGKIGRIFSEILINHKSYN